MTTAVARPKFDVDRHAEVGRYVTDGRRLLEIAAVQMTPEKVATSRNRPRPRLRLVDCAERIPEKALDELMLGEWMSVADAQRRLRVVRRPAVEA